MNGMFTSTMILPPGFRFHPTDQELIVYYLRKKISCSANPEVSMIADVNIYNFNPWELPAKAISGESEWFFFSPRDRKYPNGARPNRAAASGYWKATGTDKPILTTRGSQCLGVKKALVFYRGRPPKGTKTNWVMLEYRLLDDSHQPQKLRGSMRLDDWVLCRVRQKTNSLQQKEDTYDSSSSCSPPFNRASLQDQGIKRKNNTFQDYDFQACLLPPLQITQRDEQCQQGSSKHSLLPEECNSGQTNVSSLKEALESIKKVLSIGALEELVPVPPKKKLHVDMTDTPENASMFQVSSPITHPWSFSGFTI